MSVPRARPAASVRRSPPPAARAPLPPTPLPPCARPAPQRRTSPAPAPRAASTAATGTTVPPARVHAFLRRATRARSSQPGRPLSTNRTASRVRLAAGASADGAPRSFAALARLPIRRASARALTALQVRSRASRGGLRAIDARQVATVRQELWLRRCVRQVGTRLLLAWPAKTSARPVLPAPRAQRVRSHSSRAARARCSPIQASRSVPTAWRGRS